jgi:hypothetical protein
LTQYSYRLSLDCCLLIDVQIVSSRLRITPIPPNNTYQLIIPTIRIMESTITSSPIKPPSHHLDVPTDDELQRGRKRRRSSGATPPPHLTSNGSTNLRGRGRRRSLSQSHSFNTSESLEQQARSLSPTGRKSPGKKYQKKGALGVSGRNVKKRRSQSPSRSRSLEDGKSPKPRRRQRTRSRSRIHGEEKKKDSETSRAVTSEGAEKAASG